MGWGSKVSSTLSASAQPPAALGTAPACPSLGLGLRAFALHSLACVPPAPNGCLSPPSHSGTWHRYNSLPGTGNARGTISDPAGPMGSGSSFSTGDRAQGTVVPSQGGHPSLSLQPDVPPEFQTSKSNSPWASRIHLGLLVAENNTTTHSGQNLGGAPALFLAA